MSQQNSQEREPKSLTIRDKARTDYRNLMSIVTPVGIVLVSVPLGLAYLKGVVSGWFLAPSAVMVVCSIISSLIRVMRPSGDTVESIEIGDTGFSAETAQGDSIEIRWDEVTEVRVSPNRPTGGSMIVVGKRKSLKIRGGRFRQFAAIADTVVELCVRKGIRIQHSKWR